MCSSPNFMPHLLTPQAYDSVLQELAFCLRIPEGYIEACRTACGFARSCDPDVDTWIHSAWSHATSLSFWLLQFLTSFSSAAIADQKSQKALEASALWVSDHFEYAVALIETDVKLTSAESATCDMIRGIIKLCSRDIIAVAAVQSCIRDFFNAISSKLKDPSLSSIPYPLCSYFAHAMLSLLFPNPIDVSGRPVSVAQFLSASNTPVVRSVLGVSSVTLNAIFAFQVAKASSKQPTVELMQKLVAMVPGESSQTSVSDQSDWEILFQLKARESTAGILLNVLKNYRNTLLLPNQSAEKSLDLVEEVRKAARLLACFLILTPGCSCSVCMEPSCAQRLVA
jgi:hypothetical protein